MTRVRTVPIDLDGGQSVGQSAAREAGVPRGGDANASALPMGGRLAFLRTGDRLKRLAGVEKLARIRMSDAIARVHPPSRWTTVARGRPMASDAPANGEPEVPRLPSACLLHLLADIRNAAARLDLPEERKAFLSAVADRTIEQFLTTDHRTVDPVRGFLTDVAARFRSEEWTDLSIAAQKRIDELPSASADPLQYVTLYRDDVSTRVFEDEVAKHLLHAPAPQMIESAGKIAHYLIDRLGEISCEDGHRHAATNAGLLLDLKTFFMNEWVFDGAGVTASRHETLLMIKRGLWNKTRVSAQEIKEDLIDCLRPPIDDKYKILLVPFIATNLTYFFINATRGDGREIFPWKSRSEAFLKRVIDRARSRSKGFNACADARRPTPIHGIRAPYQRQEWIEDDMYSFAARNVVRVESRLDEQGRSARLQNHASLHGLPPVCDLSGSILDVLHIASELKRQGIHLDMNGVLMLSFVNNVYTGSHSLGELLPVAHFLNGPLALGLPSLGSCAHEFDHADFTRQYVAGMGNGDEGAISNMAAAIRDSGFSANYFSLLRHCGDAVEAGMSGTIAHLREHSRRFGRGVTHE